MTKANLIIIFVLTFQMCFSQSVDLKLINYNGLNFYSSKSQIKKRLGNPIKVFEPNYECGFLSSYEQTKNYFTLDYGKIKFTGNEDEGYLIEFVDFENDNSIVLRYGNNNLTCETKIAELAKLFGQELIKHFANDQNEGVIIFQEQADDGIRIMIKNGHLIRFKYWSPC